MNINRAAEIPDHGATVVRRVGMGAGCGFLAWATLAWAAFAQTPAAAPAPNPAAPATKPATPPATKPAAGTPAKPGEKKEEIKPPEPQGTFVRTKDGWNIFLNYYGPKEKVRPGKLVPPLILVHGWEGQGSEYAQLATELQNFGFAVIVPDLRGHGRSISRRFPNGEDKTVKVDDLKPDDIEAMVNDLEMAKKHLLERHNKGELNIEMLVVAGAEVGSIIALNWAAMDWSWPITPAYKQGQDVKAVILLSPQRTFKRLNARIALQHPAINRQLSILFMVGEEDRSAYSEAKSMHETIRRARPDVTRDDEDRLKKQDLFLLVAPTSLQGTKLLSDSVRINNVVFRAGIFRFLDWRVLRKAEEMPWAERKSPLGG